MIEEEEVVELQTSEQKNHTLPARTFRPRSGESFPATATRKSGRVQKETQVWTPMSSPKRARVEHRERSAASSQQRRRTTRDASSSPIIMHSPSPPTSSSRSAANAEATPPPAAAAADLAASDTGTDATVPMVQGEPRAAKTKATSLKCKVKTEPVTSSDQAMKDLEDVKKENEEEEDIVVERAVCSSTLSAQWAPYPVAAHLDFHLPIKREEMREGREIPPSYGMLNKIAVKVSLIVRRDPQSDDEIIGLRVTANEEMKSGMWRMEAKITVDLGRRRCTDSHKFHAKMKSREILIGIKLSDILKEDSEYVNEDGELLMRVRITAESVSGYAQPFVYTLIYPHRHLSDAHIEVEDQSFFVNRSILAVRSPFFYKAYYGPDASRNGKMRIRFCTPVDFGSLLAVVYGVCPSEVLSIDNIDGVMRLANRLEMPDIVMKCVDFFNPDRKLVSEVLRERRYTEEERRHRKLEQLLIAARLADDLKLADLHEIVLQGIFSNNLFAELQASEVYAQLSNDFKVVLLETHLERSARSQ